MRAGLPISHIVFDCDGVLVDSEPISMRIDVEILAENGIVMSEAEAHRRFVGKTFAAMIAMCEHDFGVRFPADCSAEKDRRILEAFTRELRPVQGVAAALAALRGPFSVASNSPRQRVAESLRITGLTPFFGARIVTFEDVARAKPAPDIFIEAARRAGHESASCLIVEDSVTGVTAAHLAGSPVLGFTGTHDEPQVHGARLLAAGAAHVFARMEELPALADRFR
jgi:HAD superfamily hydrolase (TIGR01509 family)